VQLLLAGAVAPEIHRAARRNNARYASCPRRTSLHSPLPAVTAFAGRPAFVRAGRSDPTAPRYKALGYGCIRKPGPGRRDPMLVGPRGGQHLNVYCRTIYYVNLTTGKLVAFFTGAVTFHTPAGTRVGTSEADAARREGSQPEGGCNLQILLRTRVAAL
jgi:hypothetical protein